MKELGIIARNLALQHLMRRKPSMFKPSMGESFRCCIYFRSLLDEFKNSGASDNEDDLICNQR